MIPAKRAKLIIVFFLICIENCSKNKIYNQSKNRKIKKIELNLLIHLAQLIINI